MPKDSAIGEGLLATDDLLVMIGDKVTLSTTVGSKSMVADTRRIVAMMDLRSEGKCSSRGSSKSKFEAPMLSGADSIASHCGFDSDCGSFRLEGEVKHS
ncbi:hypothetical protein RRF57_007743 [Xylaria bambusicola]|uniref:Uncharacterized protein n=1 Tax=Xylaria bambusicola TaxID=326684 RepID=A0AAN7V0Y3_9PEZI